MLAAIAELGYHVNTAARSLRQGRTGVIVLAVPEVDRPYFGLLATLLVERAAARGFDLLVEQTAARRDRELDAIARSRLRSYDGLILSAVQLHDDDAVLLRGDFPIVVLGERTYTEPLDHVRDGERRGRRARDAGICRAREPAHRDARRPHRRGRGPHDAPRRGCSRRSPRRACPPTSGSSAPPT